MIGKPKYNYGDVVEFDFNGKKVGCIHVVDRYGVIEDSSDVSYDILVEKENTLYKHVREDFISNLVKNLK